MGLIDTLSLIYNLGVANLNAVVHVRPRAKSLKPRRPSHLNLLVQGNQVCSGIHGGFFIPPDVFKLDITTNPKHRITLETPNIDQGLLKQFEHFQEI